MTESYFFDTDCIEYEKDMEDSGHMADEWVCPR